MFETVDTKVPSAVEKEVQTIYRQIFPEGDASFISRAFKWVDECFSVGYGSYQAIDARYHDLEHTLQGTLCLSRLLLGRHRAGAQPEMTPHWFELVLLAILFHDTGYLKKLDDHDGTGAKFTPIHVGRSAAFAREFLEAHGYRGADITAIQNMIRCTGLQADVSAIAFLNDMDEMLGYALATADMLGQMSAPDYVEKLPVLYQEFAEAAVSGYDHADHFGAYRSPEDLVRRTPRFWSGYVLPRIEDEFRGLYRYLNEPYPDGPNPYLERIRANLLRIERASAED